MNTEGGKGVPDHSCLFRYEEITTFWRDLTIFIVRTSVPVRTVHSDISCKKYHTEHI
jgi:hypothetical protein